MRGARLPTLPSPPYRAPDEPAAASGDDLRLARLGAAGVQLLVLALAATQLVRTIWLGAGDDVAITAVALCAITALHLRHVRVGLRAQRPAYAEATVLAMAALALAGAVLVGAVWALTLSSLSTSALIALRDRRAAFAVLVACCAAPLVAGWDLPELGGPWFFAVTCLMTTTVQVVLVWLVAAADELAAARSAAAEDAVTQQRADMEERVELAVRGRLSAVAAHADDARRELSAGAADLAFDAMVRMLDLGRGAIDDLRSLLARQHDARRPPSTATENVDATPRARRLSFVLCVTLTTFPLMTLFGATSHPSSHVLVAMPAVGAIMALRAYAAWRTMACAPFPRPFVVAAVSGVAVVAAQPLSGAAGFGAGMMVAATWVLVLPGRWRWSAGLVLAGTVVYDIAAFPPHYGGPLGRDGAIVFDAVSAVVTLAGFSAALVAAPCLTRLLGDLAAAREHLARSAAMTERRRLASDLHDTIGSMLTTITVKTDLARRLADVDPRRAVSELDDVVALVRCHDDHVRSVTAGERLVPLRAELESSTRLLRDIGLDVDVTAAEAALAAPDGGPLGLVLREAVTNVVRHAPDARWAHISLTSDHAILELRVVNDGARPSARPPGLGLRSLTARVEKAGGRLHAARAGTRYCLRASVAVEDAPIADAPRLQLQAG